MNAAQTIPAPVIDAPTTRPGVLASVLALEGYAVRLDRVRRRLEDERNAATQQIAWRQHEHAARRLLGAGEIRALTDAGVLAPDPDDLQDHRTVQRRSDQLAALASLQRITEAAIERHDRVLSQSNGC